MTALTEYMVLISTACVVGEETTEMTCVAKNQSTYGMMTAADTSAVI